MADIDDIDVPAPRVPEGTRPMESAPDGDGWILGLVDQDGVFGCTRQPWAILTRGDRFPNGTNGPGPIWVDDDGDERMPRAWAPLPDPQPERTGWFPPEGTIHIESTTFRYSENGVPGDVVPGINWLIHIIRPDGSIDEYRDFRTTDTIEEARDRAAKMSRCYGLPVVEQPAPTVKASSFREATRQ